MVGFPEGRFNVRPPSLTITTGVSAAALILMFVGISVLGSVSAPTNLEPLAPVDKESLPKPKTLAEKMCCINQGIGYCPLAYHGKINGVHYYAALSQKGSYLANVASEKVVTENRFQRDENDNCQCKDYVFIPADQMLKASGDRDELMVSPALEERGLPGYVSAGEPFQKQSGTRLIKDSAVRLDDGRWFRLFSIETWTETATGSGKAQPATKILARFGQELDPNGKAKPDGQASLVEAFGCFLKIRVGNEIFYVLTRGPTADKRLSPIAGG
jgi:hypothetical protein